MVVLAEMQFKVRVMSIFRASADMVTLSLGGLSYFSYSRGFICDDVVNYEVVLANGDIVNANSECNQDLFTALKGGGNNFGIVTRFDVQAFDQGEMWGGKVFYLEHVYTRQIQALVEYLNADQLDIKIHICLSIGYEALIGSTLCMNDIFCLSPGETSISRAFRFCRILNQSDVYSAHWIYEKLR